MYSVRKLIKRGLINRWTGLLVVVLVAGLLIRFCSDSTIGGLAQPIGDKLFSKEAGVFAAIGALFLSVYRFVYLRPELFLDVDLDGNGYSQRQDGEGYDANIGLYLVNAGNRFAEDAQLTFALDAFHFDLELDTPDHPVEDYDVPTTMMDTRSGRKMGYFGGGRRHDVFFEGVVYEQDTFELYYGEAVFDEEKTHEIRYTVACRTHGLRQGKITIEMDDGDLEVTRAYPTVWRQLQAYLWWSPELKRTRRVENVDSADVNIDVEVR